MKRTILTIAAIVAAIAIYDRTAATSSEPFEPAPRTVSGGPTVVFQQIALTTIPGFEQWVAIEQTPIVSFETPVTVILDTKLHFTGFMTAHIDRCGVSVEVEQIGGSINVVDTTMEGREDSSGVFVAQETAFAGGAVTLSAGDYIFRVKGFVHNNSSADAEGWLRLQIWGCDSPAGCIPGDLNLDGRVNLLDFAILANNFQG